MLLKRGLANTLEEFVMSAEYIMAEGNENVILCERGIRTFETSMRNTLDLAGVVMLHKMTHLPVVVDPSHACGHAWMVPQLAKAAVAAGADGLMIEVHNNPAKAKCDGAQSLILEVGQHQRRGISTRFQHQSAGGLDLHLAQQLGHGPACIGRGDQLQLHPESGGHPFQDAPVGGRKIPAQRQRDAGILVACNMSFHRNTSFQG